MATGTKANPLLSAGAREERREFLAKLRRELAAEKQRAMPSGVFAEEVLVKLEKWVLGRLKRYAKRKGGL